MQCVNKNLREYQTLLEQSGLPDFELQAYVGRFLEKVGRYPHLDELQNSNSEPFIRKELKLRKDNTTKTQNILDSTNSNNINDAIHKLNNKYRDKEIEILSIGDESKLYITPRPSTNPTTINQSDVDENVNSLVYLNQTLDKLSNLYGININYISNKELTSQEWEEVPGIHGVKAFIYEGQIYVNTDIATVDSPLHEMLHIIFGSMKFQNRFLYEQLVSSASNFKSFNYTQELYPNRTREDLCEEVFITQLSKYLTGQKSDLDSLDEKYKYEIFYNMNRTLDSIFMGDASVQCILPKQLYHMNMKTIAKLVNSASMNSNYQGYLDNATLHRMLSNKKSELLEKGLLKEECV